MTSITTYILLLLFYVLNSLQDVPLCDVCLCNISENNRTSINCNEKEVKDAIYKYLNSSTILISTLSLQHNNIQSLQRFPTSKLSRLDLEHNFISEMGKEVFSGLQEMEELILGYNKIEVIHPDVFRGVYTENEYYPLKALKVLNLEFNNIRSLHEDTFEHIDELQVLVLRGNPLKAIDASTATAIASLVNLRSLDLSSAKLTDLPSSFLYTTKLLRILNLSGNGFETIPLGLKEAPALDTLYFDNNPIYMLLDNQSFPNIPTLTVLHLSNMANLEALGDHSLGSLQNLKELYLSNNKRLRNVHQDFLAKLDNGKKCWPSLLTFIMNGSNITHLHNSTIANWKNLEVLNLNDNPWSCDCDNMWIAEELIPTRKQLNGEEIINWRCNYPAKFKNTLLSEIKGQIECDESSSVTHTLLLIASIAGMLITIGCLIYVIYSCRYKRQREPLLELKFGNSIYRKLEVA